MSVKNQGPGNPESISIYLYPFYPFFYPAQKLGFLGVLIMYSSNYKTHLDVKTTPKKNNWSALKCLLTFHLPTVLLSQFRRWCSFWCQRWCCTPRSIPRILGIESRPREPQVHLILFQYISIYFTLFQSFSIVFNLFFSYFMLFLFVYICFYMFLYSSVF